jgi:hypothetical protein
MAFPIIGINFPDPLELLALGPLEPTVDYSSLYHEMRRMSRMHRINVVPMHWPEPLVVSMEMNQVDIESRVKAAIQNKDTIANILVNWPRQPGKATIMKLLKEREGKDADFTIAPFSSRPGDGQNPDALHGFPLKKSIPRQR